MRRLWLVFLGGFMGAISRYLLGKPLLAVAATLFALRGGFPFDILIINLAGAFMLGLLLGLFEHGGAISPDTRLFLGTGFLGAFTTFSSYMTGVDVLLARGEIVTGLAYLTVSIVAGVILAYSGFEASRWAPALARRRSSLSTDDDVQRDESSDDATLEAGSSGAMQTFGVSADVEGRGR